MEMVFLDFFLMKKRRRAKYGEITLSILELVASSAEMIALSFLDQKRITRSYKYGHPLELESERFFEYLRRLEKRGYVRIRIRDKSCSVCLTKKGEIKLIENGRDNIVDGKWRMISFDIPEKLRTRRDLFRSAIKRIGFRQVQKSLWACPFIKADKIEKIINYYNVKKYVCYLIVEQTDIEHYLKELFSDDLKNHKKISLKSRKN